MQFFDRYSRRARLFPGLLAALPVLLFVVVLIPSKPLAALFPLAGGVGVTFALAYTVRLVGLQVEERLLAAWDGWPTTHCLRHRTDQNKVIFERRRRALEALNGEKLPTKDEEHHDPRTADDAYVAATRFLISHVRGRDAEFPRVQDENIAYGFARNMLGLRPIAFGVIGLAFVGDLIALYLRGPSTTAFVVVGTHCLLAMFWYFFVGDDWVHRIGKKYAERLFETLESPQFKNGAFDTPGVPPQREAEDTQQSTE